MKKYENPMLQVVSINRNDIIATSDVNFYINETNEANRAPGMRFFDDWDAGY